MGTAHTKDFISISVVRKHDKKTWFLHFRKNDKRCIIRLFDWHTKKKDVITDNIGLDEALSRYLICL